MVVESMFMLMVRYTMETGSMINNMDTELNIGRMEHTTRENSFWGTKKDKAICFLQMDLYTRGNSVRMRLTEWEYIGGVMASGIQGNGSVIG